MGTWDRLCYQRTGSVTMGQALLPEDRLCYHGTGRLSYQGIGSVTMGQAQLPWDRLSYHGTGAVTRGRSVEYSTKILKS